MRALAAIVLCAGQGTRMKSMRSKMLHELAGKPLCVWSLDLAKDLGSDDVIAVLGYQREELKHILPDFVKVVVQEEQNGTGHAVQVAMSALDNWKGRILVLYGDTPLLTHGTLKGLCDCQSEVAMLTAHLKNPRGYGRIIRDRNQQIKAIVEEKDADDEQKKITEINPGIYLFNSEFLRQNLPKLQADNSQKEYYLTDLIAMTKKNIESLEVCETEILGVNDLAQMAVAEKELRKRINLAWMRAGVRMQNPKTTYIDDAVKLEAEEEEKSNPFKVIELLHSKRNSK